ncbi:hypothetical protein [Thermoflexus sp.]|uniref:hypothetical protein n=1 Tax=Thermoflexus sp. TaxID=1969742 RepID=UPI0035E41236
MSAPVLWERIVLVAAALGGIGLGWRLWKLWAHPPRPDRAPRRSAAWRGILYAFTGGMMPWAKESTRRHLVLYARGVLFHIGVAVAFASLVILPWRYTLPPVLAPAGLLLLLMGALSGLIGVLTRLFDERLRALSYPDDYAAVALVTLWQAAGAASWASSEVLPLFYGLSALTLLAIPLTKIRHCLYFFFSRFFFGRFYGRRGVLS